MARGSIQRRCKVCRQKGLSGRKKCKHKDAKYQIVYYIGKKQKSKTIGPNKKEAEKVLAETLSQLNSGSYKEIEQVLFEEFAKKWFEHYRITSKVKPTTLRTYRDYIENHFNPAFKNLYVSNIKTRHVDELLAKASKGRKAKTVNKILTSLKTMFKFAVRWNYIKENPASDVEKFKEEHFEREYLSPEEIRVLLSHAREPYKTLFLTAISTGMRFGELLALRWSDIDWRQNKIFVRKSLHIMTKKEQLEEGVESKYKFLDPKSRHSRRGVVMSANLKKALEVHKINAPINELDLVFTNEQGKPMDQSNLRNREFYQTLEFAGIRRVPFHSLRHSYASLLIAQGENPKFIQSQLGHYSITMTMDTYGHLFPDAVEGVGDRLDKQVFGVTSVQDLPIKCK